MKLSKWAELNSVTYRTAWEHFRTGKIPGAYKLVTGTVVVPDKPNETHSQCTVVYARVSSSENKKNLITQADRVSSFCSAKGWTVNNVVMECASGLNDTRPKLMAVLKEEKVSRIVVEHKDRLTRFGFNYIKLLWGGEIVVINEVVEDEHDLMQDFVSLVTSFTARLYGRRRSKRATEKLIKELNNDSTGL